MTADTKLLRSTNVLCKITDVITTVLATEDDRSAAYKTADRLRRWLKERQLTDTYKIGYRACEGVWYIELVPQHQ